MRYADLPSVEVTERIAATAEDAWAAVTDVELSSRFSPELQEVHWLGDEREVVVGARFRGRNEHEALGSWTTESQFVEVEAPRRLVWEVRGADGAPAARWGLEIEPARDGVLVRHWGRMGPGSSGLTWAIQQMPDKEGRIVEKRLQEWGAGMRATLTGLKEQLEG